MLHWVVVLVLVCCALGATPGVPPVPCNTRVGSLNDTCVEGAVINSATWICECYQENYACDETTSLRGTCRKLKASSSSKASPSGGELIGFAAVIFLTLFCIGNMIFFNKNKRLPYWVNNMCCTCPPVASCDEQKKSEHVERKNPMDALSRRGPGPSNIV